MLIWEPKILELPSLYPGYMVDVNNCDHLNISKVNLKS